MTTTYTQATADMFGLLKPVWDVQVTAALGLTVPAELRWQGNEKEQSIPGDVFWGRISRQTLESEQTSLSTCVGTLGGRRYTEFGLIFVQLFGPISDGASQAKLGKVAELMRNALRRKSTPNVVWFRRASINELPQEKRFNRLNVVAEFNYDEVF